METDQADHHHRAVGGGGATDQVTRLAAAELEPGLGQKIVVVNQPGGAGSIGTKAVLDAPKDGYTWTARAASNWAPTRCWA